MKATHSRPPLQSSWCASALWLGILLGCVSGRSADNLALGTGGAAARSWVTGLPTIAGHEPAKANDGRFHTYWLARAEELPADLGIEWPTPRRVSSVVVRYFDGNMIRGPAVARTQPWARLQCWSGGRWQDIEAELLGQETCVVRYVFPPITTTRIRLLFTEPPDPEARRFPDRLGISVCELEAYADVPFQWVSSPNRVVGEIPREAGYQQNFNEPPTGDCSFDAAGPLIIEPLQTRVFQDTLTPTLIVSESHWARTACESQSKGNLIRLRNGFLELEIRADSRCQEQRVVNRVTGESYSTPEALIFRLHTGEKVLGPEHFRVEKMDTAGSGPEVSRLRVDLAGAQANVSVHYELRRQDHFYHKWLTIKNKSNADLLLRDVVVTALGMAECLDLMAGQELTYPVFRMKQGGFFACLETVYWDHQGDTLVYYPGVKLAPGADYTSEKGVVGVYRQRGELVGGWDRGVREWVTEYHAQTSPTPPIWPDVYCEAWSAAFGIRDVVQRPAWVERFMATARQVGIGYLDVYEAIHEAALMPEERVRRFMDLGRRHGIGVGFWADFGSAGDFAGLGRPLRPHPCKLSPEAEAHLRQLVEVTRKYQFGAAHWGDFLCVWPCSQTNHGHLPGKHSIYAQGQRVLRLAQELRAASPGIVLGADGGFTNPQYVRYEDGHAHGTFYGGFDGDHWGCVEPDLHLDRLYADMNRAYAYGSYAIYLRPWYRLLNCVNHYGQETHTHDRAGFRYGLLSALAMAAQVTFNDVPVDMPASEIAFARRWLSWARTNQHYLKQGDRLFDRSLHYADEWQGDAYALSGFAHLRGDRGYVFLLNPSPLEQVAELKLALAASSDQRFVVEEVYPGDFPLAGPDDGGYRQGGRLRLTVPGKQARILWIAPASPGASSSHTQPEAARVTMFQRYLGNWRVTETNAERARLQAQFTFPPEGRSCLTNSIPEPAWSKEPWGYDKAYLMLLLKDESRELNSNWVPDHFANPDRGAGRLTVSVNGTPKPVQVFRTKRVQWDKLTRCYFVDLEGEVNVGQSNTVDVTVPIRTGLVFAGAYLDLPDQMP